MIAFARCGVREESRLTLKILARETGMMEQQLTGLRKTRGDRFEGEYQELSWGHTKLECPLDMDWGQQEFLYTESGLCARYPGPLTPSISWIFTKVKAGVLCRIVMCFWLT